MLTEGEARNSGNNERAKTLVPMYSDRYVFRYVCIKLGSYSDMSKSFSSRLFHICSVPLLVTICSMSSWVLRRDEDLYMY